jgi:hypothetical protein
MKRWIDFVEHPTAVAAAAKLARRDSPLDLLAVGVGQPVCVIPS